MTFERAKNLINEIVEDWITNDYDDRLDDVLEARKMIFEYAENFFWSSGYEIMEIFKPPRHGGDLSLFCTSFEPTSASNPPAAKENLYGSNKFNL